MRLEKRLLYATASARFAAASAADIVAVAVGIDEIIVGTLDTVTDGMDETDPAVEGPLVDVAFVDALEAARLEVDNDVDEDGCWKPPDAASDESEETPVVGGTMESVLLSVNLGTEDVGAGVVSRCLVTDFEVSCNVEVGELTFVKDPTPVWILVEVVPGWVVWTEEVEEMVTPALTSCPV